jgi:hypothetical protein
MTAMTIRRILRAWPAALLLLLGLAGCFNPFDPRIAPTTGIYIPPPTPNSAQNVIRLFEWCWRNRDITTYEQIFTADFRFVFALGDSAGNLFRDEPVTRDMELNIARNLFVGGGTASPASSILLNLDPTLRALPDSRPGKNPIWHNEIVTGVDLTIKTEAGAEYHIQGNARFFVVRGDSARIPEELGLKSDSTRWYIDQWNDETLQGAGGNTVARPTDPGALRAVRTRDPLAVAAADRVPRRPRLPAGLDPLPYDVSWGQLNALYAR